MVDVARPAEAADAAVLVVAVAGRAVPVAVAVGRAVKADRVAAMAVVVVDRIAEHHRNASRAISSRT